MQLMLFSERFVVPYWSNLAESTRVEVVKLLAKLLVSVHMGSAENALQSRGAHNE
jgi:hypothetical protein